MRANLSAKLALAFVLVALTGIILVAILANRATAVSFQRYLQAGDTQRLQRLADDVGLAFSAQGGWAGVNALLRDSAIGPEAGGAGYFLRVVDAGGQVVGSRGGQGRATLDFDQVVPIMANGVQVGSLLAAQAGQGERAAEQFLASVNQALLWAGITAVIIALILGVVLAQQLTRPLRRLTAATQAVAAGDFSQQVPITSSDELGDLARDFNQMARALELSEMQRQQMLADTAHDLRTPISIMRSHLEAMLDGVFEPTPENLAVVHEETLQLSRLVEDVRTLSIAEAGQLPLALQPVDLAELAASAAAAFAPLAEADGITLTVATTSTPCVSGDPARLQQVLANLIANALRYAPQGGSAAPAVHITVSAAAGEAAVSITDNGPGLSSAQQAHVFDRFWRSDAARGRDQGGSGLGLAIARSIVQAHGGSIAVSGEPGVGTTFTITLPTTKDN
jgi:signal transduction histidine kinase